MANGNASPMQFDLKLPGNMLEKDEAVLAGLGYRQELRRRMSGFANFAMAFSLICILSGCITSFHLGFCTLGGAAIFLGWPLSFLFSLTVALIMAELASAFPTAGGIYHWAAILGGRGWGWITAWFNLIGLVTMVAAVNVGTFQFTVRALGPQWGFSFDDLPPLTQYLSQTIGVCIITFTQAAINHRGIRLTALLTNVSGYLILLGTVLLVSMLLYFSSSIDLNRLITFVNYSGQTGDNTWPATSNFTYLFFLSALLPAYTITGFDIAAHTAEETVDASIHVPRGMVRSVIAAGVAGWILVSVFVLAVPNLNEGASKGANIFFYMIENVMPHSVVNFHYGLIAVTQYICGLASLTSTSRMVFAFARDGGLPQPLRRISPTLQTPAVAIWVVAFLSIFFIIYSPMYATITVVSITFLYLSYVFPIILGFLSHQRSWTTFGPWSLGKYFKPLAVLAIGGNIGIIWISMQPPNDIASMILILTVIAMSFIWLRWERHRFPGPKVQNQRR